MKRDCATGRIRYSPLDLVNFTRSPFLSWMDRKALDDPELAAERDPPDRLMDILARHGNEHEVNHLAALRSAGMGVVVLGRDNACAGTVDAIRDGADIIYQAYVESGSFGGYADFLKRVADGAGYEVWDTKLATHVKPEYLIQLCAYVDMIEALTGACAETAGVILGDGTEVPFHIPEYFDYYCYKRDEFLAFIALCDDGAPCPEPEIGADHGHWSGAAQKRWLADDHLVQVANITRRQISCLEAAGITSLKELAHTRKRRVAGIDATRFARLRAQAALQHATRLARARNPKAAPSWKLLDAAECRPGLGYAALPEPVPEGDIFFDIEGDPTQKERLEYLLGAAYIEDGDQKFRAFWAHTFEEERESFRKFMAWVAERRRNYPSMHIYHYAAYENTALKKLASRHDLCLDDVDDLLRQGVLVDLYSVVRNALRLGEANYSLKSVEHLYLRPREDEVATASDSVIQYDRFRQLCDSPDDECRREAARILSAIEDYNRVDCESTLALTDWLRSRRPSKEDTAATTEAPDAEAANFDAPPLSEKAASKAALKQALREHALALREQAAISGDPVCKVLADVLNYHEREDKPTWWRYFALKEADADDLHDAEDALVGARFERSEPVGGRSRSQIVTFAFDADQDCEFRVGERAEILEWPDESGWGADGEITALEMSAGCIKLKITNTKLAKRVAPDTLPPVTIVLKPQTFDKSGFQNRLLELAQAVLSNASVPPALRHFVERAQPPVSNVTPGAVTDAGIDPDAIARRLANATGFALCVQGPPGTGKTYTFGHIAARLIGAGKRVGVVAGSHEVMRNFVRAVGEARIEFGLDPDEKPLFCQAKGVDTNELEEAMPCASAFRWEDWGDETYFVAGTHFFFARPDAVRDFDYLFVDEAGQFALADLVALSPVARSLILIGDPQQLSHVIQGSHPGCGGQSCLEYALNGQDVLAEDQGLFLSVTYRLRPEICGFVSDLSYTSRLRPAYANASRAIGAEGQKVDDLPALNGLVYLPIEHGGNCQDSPEEAALIVQLTQQLLGLSFDGGEGPRPLSIEDFLYVSPYNLQVARLREALPDGARVGSVNLFQGQQSVVVFVSLCASPGEFGPRGLGFILDRNRMNVAVSRAQCLAIVLGNPGLLSAPADNAENVRQLNILARLVQRHSVEVLVREGPSQARTDLV